MHDLPFLVNFVNQGTLKLRIDSGYTPEFFSDLRFLSIDFLNTFLLTYRVFTDGVTVLDALKRVFFNNETDSQGSGSIISLEVLSSKDENTLSLYDERRRSSFSPRRTSGASSVSGYGSEMSERDRSHSYDSQGHRQWKTTMQKCKLVDEYATCPQYEITVEEGSRELGNITEYTQPRIIRQSPTHKAGDALSPPVQRAISIRVEKITEPQDTDHLSIPKVAASSSSETLTGKTLSWRPHLEIPMFPFRCYGDECTIITR